MAFKGQSHSRTERSKTIRKHHLTLIEGLTITAKPPSSDAEKLGPCILCRNENVIGHGENNVAVPQSMKNRVLCNVAILSIY